MVLIHTLPPALQILQTPEDEYNTFNNKACVQAKTTFIDNRRANHGITRRVAVVTTWLLS